MQEDAHGFKHRDADPGIPCGHEQGGWEGEALARPWALGEGEGQGHDQEVDRDHCDGCGTVNRHWAGEAGYGIGEIRASEEVQEENFPAPYSMVIVKKMKIELVRNNEKLPNIIHAFGTPESVADFTSWKLQYRGCADTALAAVPPPTRPGSGLSEVSPKRN